VLSGGFQNDGIWLLRDASKGLILKLAKSRQTTTMPSEAQKILNLCKKFPSMKDDPSLAFPSQILKCFQMGSHVYDLIVMPQAPGLSIAEVIAKKLTQPAEIMRLMSEVGRCISGFHSRYPGHQHNDFHASNVLFDEASGRITLIDLCDIAPKLPVAMSDAEYFVNSLERMSYPRQFCIECKRSLESGYGMSKQVAKACYSGSVRLLARY